MNLHDFCSSNIKSFPSFHDCNQTWSLWKSHQYSETDILSSLQSDKGIACWTQNYRLYKIQTAPLSERCTTCLCSVSWFLLKHVSFQRYWRTDFRSILKLQAPHLQESGTVLEVSKITPSMIQFLKHEPCLSNCIIDGVILETSRTVPGSWRWGACDVEIDLKSLSKYR